MSILIRIGNWFSNYHHRRLLGRLRMSADAQRRFLLDLATVGTNNFSRSELMMHRMEIERITRTINHLEGLINDLKISDNFNLYI